MSRRIIITCLSGLLGFYAPQTLANSFNYSFFEFRSAANPSSLGIEMNMPLMPNLHVVGRADKQFGNAFDIAGGAGFNGPYSDFMDLNGQILLHYADGDTGVDGYDNSGVLLELNIGTRVWLSETMELHGKIGSVEDKAVVEAGLRFHSTNQLTVGAKLRNNGIWGPQTSIEVRFEF